MNKLAESINVETAFNPEVRKAQSDFDEYLSSRPSVDVNGKFHSPENGSFISKDAAENYYSPQESLEEEDLYEQMSFKELCELSVDAELHNDKTTLSSVDEYIQNKIGNMALKDNRLDRDGTSRVKSERGLFIDRVAGLREKIKREKLHETPSDISDLDNDQIKRLEKAWELSSGEKKVWKSNTASEVESEAVVERLALPPAPDTNSEDDAEIVDDQDNQDNQELIITPVSDGDRSDIIDESQQHEDQNEEAEQSETESSKSWKKRVAAVIGLAAIAAAAIGVLTVADGEEESDRNPSGNAEAVADNEADEAAGALDLSSVAEEFSEDETPALDLSDVAEEFSEDTTAEQADTEESTQAEASTTNESEGTEAVNEADAELIDEMVENISEDQLSVYSGLDASAIKVSGNVWPWVNITEAGAHNPNQVAETTLAAYNSIFGRNFVYNYDNGMFIETENGVTHIMNPAELVQWNQTLKNLTEKAN